jgi:phage baseplate assembly protein W
MAASNLYGKGLGFPPRVGPDGHVAWSEGEENVRESIRVILMTEPRERIQLAEFGAGLMRFLFEPNTSSTRFLIEERIRETLRRWEPRVRVESVQVETDPDDAEAAIATILYRLIATQQRERLTLSVSLGAT